MMDEAHKMAQPSQAEDDQERARQRELMQHAASSAASLAVLDQSRPVIGVDDDHAMKESQADSVGPNLSGQSGTTPGAVYSN